MKRSSNLFLIGSMGSGKTTIGKYLAQELNRPFFDTDEEIERRSGVEIGWIFDVEGEEKFREREKQMIEELTLLPSIILATGGGAVLRLENRKNLSSRGTVIYLQTNVESIIQRTMKDKKRPLIRDVNTRTEKLTQLLNERTRLYLDIADFIISTDERSAKMVGDEILSTLIQVRR